MVVDHLKYFFVSLILISAPIIADVVDNRHHRQAQDDLQSIAAPLPEAERKDILGNMSPEKFSCIHTLVSLSVLKDLLSRALQQQREQQKQTTTTPSDVMQGAETTTVESDIIDSGNLTFVGPNLDLQLDSTRFTVIDTFTLPGFDGSNPASTSTPPPTRVESFELLHRWSKMAVPIFSPKSTYSYHDLYVRVANSSKVVAIWNGQMLIYPEAGIYQSQWAGSSINLFNPRYAINVTWNLHAVNGQGCWFGDSVSYEQATIRHRSLSRWTHLIEYPGNNTWSGFVVIKNLCANKAPTQFWAGHGNSTVDVLAKSNWKDYTYIWLGTEEDEYESARNLSRGWIWTMFTIILTLCAVLSWLVYWLTSERVDLKSKRQTSWMTILARARNMRRGSSTSTRPTTGSSSAPSPSPSNNNV